jgi:hypothetical protein
MNKLFITFSYHDHTDYQGHYIHKPVVEINHPQVALQLLGVLEGVYSVITCACCGVGVVPDLMMM